jgi:antitoxin (DNA-binding transcriptional repressor) of toxin-antitoxin stability system
LAIRETTFTEFRNHAKRFFDCVERGETVRIYRNGRPVAELMPFSIHTPAWKNPPKVRLSLCGLMLSEEIVADREHSR